MKANPWLLPVAALLGTGGWIISQKHTSATLEREIAALTERIRQARAADDDNSRKPGPSSSDGKSEDGNVDWKDVAGKISQSRGGGMGEMRTYMRVQKILLEMTPDELIAQLDEIATLDLEDSVRSQLRGMILGVLADKDPKLVLEHFGDEIRDEKSNVRWQLQGALAKLAETDPAAAAAWLDRQIAAGVFQSKSLDGKNQDLLRFEGVLVARLLGSNPAEASARVAALLEDQRGELFRQGLFFQVSEENEASFAKLVRESMPEEKVGGILAERAGMLTIRGDYNRVDDFITRANASDDEKAAIIDKVMKQNFFDPRSGEFSEESAGKARDWAATQSPAIVDKATGEALGNALLRSGDYGKISSLVLKYNETSGNDDVLASFLKSDAARHRSPDKAAALIGQIKDPALREEILALPEYRKPSAEP